MYLVTIVNGRVETVINSVDVGINSPRISGTVKQGINSIDSFSFTVYPNNPGYNIIKPFSTLVKVYNTKTCKYEFIGRALKPSSNMESSGEIYKTWICESELGYLIDSMQTYGEYHNISIRDYLKLILDVHNSRIEKDKQFKLGNVTVSDSNDSIYKYLDYDSTWKNINDDLIGTYGGELQIRYEGNDRYLDYLTEIGEVKETEIRLGKNIQDITEDKDPTNFYTRLIPLGNKLSVKDADGNDKETDERLDIKSVNNGLNYIDDIDAISIFGIIEGCKVWDDVSKASNLMKKGEKYLKSQRIVISNKITALDLNLIGLDIDSFEVGNYYPLKHPLLDIDYTVRIVEKTISIESPEASSLTFGDRKRDIKQYQLDTKKQAYKTMKLEKELKNNTLKINNANIKIKNTSDSVIGLSKDVISLGTNTNETITKMTESIILLNDAVISINANLSNVNNTLDNINKRLSKLEGDDFPPTSSLKDFPYASELVNLAVSYWQNCDNEYINEKPWSQGLTYRSKNTPLSLYCDSNMDSDNSLWVEKNGRHYKAIDCSTLIGLCVRGYGYENSPYYSKSKFDEFRTDRNQTNSAVSWAFALPRTAAEQGEYFYDKKWIVPLDTIGNVNNNFAGLKKGDLVFWAKKNEDGSYKEPNRFMNISHVGIVYGNSSKYSNRLSIIESTNSTTKKHTWSDGTTLNAGVRIKDLANNYIDDVVLVARIQK